MIMPKLWRKILIIIKLLIKNNNNNNNNMVYYNILLYFLSKNLKESTNNRYLHLIYFLKIK